MGNHDPEKPSLETEKISLEIALLHRQLERSRFYEVFIDKWAPSLIAAVILFTLVPFANFLLWKGQKSIELSNIHLAKKMEIYSESASNATRFTQLMSLINEFRDAINGKATKNKDVAITNDKTIAARQIVDLQRQRLDVESRLIKSLREIKIYFGPDASKKVDTIRDLYNEHKGPLDRNFISKFLNEYNVLLRSLEAEILKELRGT